MASSSNPVFGRNSVNGGTGAVALYHRPHLDRRPYRNMSMKQMRAYKSPVRTRNPDHDAELGKIRICILLKHIAQLESSAIHHLFAFNWDIPRATVAHRACTKLSRNKFEIYYRITNNALRNFLSGYLVPLPVNAYLEKTPSPPYHIRSVLSVSTTNDDSSSATEDQKELPHQVNVALAVTADQHASQTGGPSTKNVDQGVTARSPIDPFSAANTPDTITYLAVFREVTRVGTEESLRMFLRHYSWDRNKAFRAYAQHPNRLNRVKAADLTGFNVSQVFLRTDDLSLNMYAAKIAELGIKLDEFGVNFDFDVILFALRMKNWDVESALHYYKELEQILIMRCADIDEEAEPSFEDDGSDTEDAVGVVRRHGEPTPERAIDTDVEDGIEGHHMATDEQSNAGASNDTDDETGPMTLNGGQHTLCPKTDKSGEPNFRIPTSDQWWLAPPEAWEKATSHLNNPRSSFLYYQKVTRSKLKWFKYKQPVNWSSIGSLRRLDSWRRQVRKAMPGATLLREAPIPYLPEENEYLKKIKREAPKNFRWDDLQKRFNEKFEGRILDGYGTVRPHRSTVSVQIQFGREEKKEGKEAGGKTEVKKGVKRAAEEMEDGGEGEGKGPEAATKRFKGNDEGKTARLRGEGPTCSPNGWL